MTNGLRRLSSMPLWQSAQGKVLAVLLAMLAVGLADEAFKWGRETWRSFGHHSALVSLKLHRGVAISLNRYQKLLGRDVQLPRMRIEGALCERAEDDWILFGEAADDRPGLPLDAVALAARTLREGMDAPGIDIRPAAGNQRQQQVSYFGGVGETVVGRWFYEFDYWMKEASLDRDPRPVPGLPVYWRRAVAELERSVETCKSPDRGEWSRGNRYWLCAGEFQGVESNDTLVFQSTPMLVLAEKLEKNVWAGSGESPCASKGTDDPVAAEFADWLTRHLEELRGRVPVYEIESFAQLVSAFTWLSELDPQRDLKPWMRNAAARIETPDDVATLEMETTRSHMVSAADGAWRHEHKLLVSGGVMVAPRLARVKDAGDTLETLSSAIVAARPATGEPYWFFTYERK